MELGVLAHRARLLRRLRGFFEARGLTEVTTPLLSARPTLEAHIDLFETEGRYLPPSPEYAMKRLLAQGSGSIFQIAPAFRAGEEGPQHNPEFTMLEFYLVEQDLAGLHDWVAQMLVEVFGWPEPERFDYVSLFAERLGIDALEDSFDRFVECLKERNQPLPPFLLKTDAERADWLDYLFCTLIEPNLSQEKPAFVSLYPTFMAALAQIKQGRAQRFEVFYKGLELGNGYDELRDPAEQRARFAGFNKKRQQEGREPLALDERFLSALENLPPCAGIAFGFERLVMADLGLERIGQVLPFSWPEA